MKLLNEEQLLDPAFRLKVIEDIKSPANQARKKEARKRHEVFKDNVVKHVMLKLKREIKKDETLALMENRAANISICKKIINKLSRVYSGSVTRTTGVDVTDIQVSELAKLLNFNQKQKKADRYTRLFKNCLPWIYPDLVDGGKYRLCLRLFDPSQYDVIESINEPEEAACIILSEFIDRSSLQIPLGSGPQVTQLEATRAVSGDSIISNSSNAVKTKDTETFIFWSNKYHFTTDEKGNIIGVGSITPSDLLNPIGVIPGPTCAEDQDGQYWASGGEDVVDGSILVNTMITDMNAIAYMQGWGQLVITGEHIPDEFAVGPHHALTLTYDSKKGQERPEVTVVNANPPLEAWMKMVEQYVALLLSTNNLSVTSVSSKLDVSNFPAGIAMLIDRSESTDSIEDKQNDFYWVELKEWEIIKRWHNLYYDRGLLSKEFSDIGRLPEDLRVTPKFDNDRGEVMTEADRLENLKRKKEIGIASQVDLIMADNPGMTKEEAEKKLIDIKTQNLSDVVDAANKLIDSSSKSSSEENHPTQ